MVAQSKIRYFLSGQNEPSELQTDVDALIVLIRDKEAGEILAEKDNELLNTTSKFIIIYNLNEKSANEIIQLTGRVGRRL